MNTDLALNSLELFKRAVVQAYPSSNQLPSLVLDGTLVQAWQSVARLLGIDTGELARKLAPLYGVSPAGDLYGVQPEILGLVPYNFCQTNTVLPLRIEEGALVVASADPLNRDVAERLGFLANRRLQMVLAAPDKIEDVIVIAFSREAARSASEEGQRGTNAAVVDENAVTKLGRALFLDAIAQRASDLHIQPFLGAAAVRIRVDGILRRLTMLPEAVAVTLIRHIKARSGMESTNMLIPQDGRMSLVAEGQEFDLRVSTLPASGGERLVVRFLDQSRVHRLSGAGFSLAALHTLRRAMARPSGLVVITGPTGSGKTSTLYAMLAEINRSTINIITVENPVEYRIAGISQVEVNEKAGRSFSASLRSILRQDPDVILIGEIRDKETAEIATAAALTGHLVLATLHTNDALTAIPRLLNLGLDPSILADSLAVVAAQRLCRVLCPHCKTPTTDPLTPQEKLFGDMTRNRPGHRAVGCKACDFTGYRGRLPVVDIVEVSKPLREAIAQGETRLSVLEGLREGGLKSLAASGAQRVISGDTTVAEVMETVGPSFWADIAAHYGAAFTDNPELDTVSQIVGGQGVLLMSQDPALAAQLAPAMELEGLRLVVAKTAEEARECLRLDEDIAFIIGDVDDRFTLQQATQHLANNRLHIAWARLPAVVLVAAPLMYQRDELLGSGVLGELMPKPVDLAALKLLIRRSQAR
jgi:type II secretory ATPase GspE/PulE/Tfp pilus assembly ATPase PilB-like protein